MWESDGRECLLGQMSDQACESFLQSKRCTQGQNPYIHCSEQRGPARGADASSDPAGHEESQTHVRPTGSSLPRREGTERGRLGHYDCQLQTSEGKAGWWHHSQVEYLRGASGKLGPSPEGFSASPQAGEESPRPQMNDSFKRTRHTRNCTVKCCI